MKQGRRHFVREMSSVIIIIVAVIVAVAFCMQRCRQNSTLPWTRDAYARAMTEPSPVASKIFLMLSIAVLAAIFSVWQTFDFANGRMTVVTHSWWGLAAGSHDVSASRINVVEVKLRRVRVSKGYLSVGQLVFTGEDGTILIESRPVWRAETFCKQLNDELKRGDHGSFHGWSLSMAPILTPYLMAFIFLSWLFARGMGPQKRRPENLNVKSNASRLARYLQINARRYACMDALHLDIQASSCFCNII